MKRILILLSLVSVLMLSVFAGSASAYSSDTGWYCQNLYQVVPYGNGVLECRSTTHTFWYLRP